MVEPQGRTVDQLIAGLAARQHGVVTRRQLRTAGVTPGQVRHRLKRGALLGVHPGVYRVGHEAPDLLASYLAAVYACGAGAVLGGRAATHNFAVARGASPSPEVNTRTERMIPGVITHRCRRLDGRDTRRWNGIPTVTVPRALVEVAAILAIADLARACHEAGVRYRTTPRQVEDALGRRPTSAGARNLRLVLSGDERVALSRLESAFIAMLRTEGLSLPVTNKPAGGRRVDCRWPEEGLTVELDSFTFHNSRHSWQQDRDRERQAYARGDEFRRYTWADVFEDPTLMLTELRDLLSGERPVLVS